jgi:hypothetical protein
MNITVRFAEEPASLAKAYADDGDEPAAPDGGGRFAEHAMITLYGPGSPR